MSRTNGTTPVLDLRDMVKTENEAGSKTEHERQAEAILAALDKLGETRVGEDGLVFQGDRFVLPVTMRGNINGAIKYLRQQQEVQEKEFTFSRTFDYRPWDGAAAFQRAMRRVFGTSGVGASIHTFFGEIKPEFITVNISATETISVPWRNVGFSPLEAEFSLGARMHAEYGAVFHLEVEAPRKHRSRIEGFFSIVEDELKKHSIYRGKAFTGGKEPVFLDLSVIPPVIYTDEVMTQLDTNLWAPLRYSDALRAQGLPLKRAVLIEGPYGTGKTLAGMLTAREAVANGWTFVLARTGKDDLDEVLQTARLYAPAVVWYEDIDIEAAGENPRQISGLLDTLDSVSNKNTEIIAGFTTNHVAKIQKGVLRPGRLDAVVSVHGLDRDGFERLIRALISPKNLDETVNFDQVAEAFEGFLPAFAKEAIGRAMTYSIARNRGVMDTITTADLVSAAAGLRPQLDLMNGANEGVRKSSLEGSFRDLVEGVVNNTTVVDYDGDRIGDLNSRS